MKISEIYGMYRDKCVQRPGLPSTAKSVETEQQFYQST